MPDFLILGTPKGGTTSLFRYLARTPGVVPATRKEVSFFNLHYGRGRYWYASRFPKRHPGTLHFEATPNYLHWPEAPKRVLRTVPEVRFIVLLREPAERAISNYYHRVRVAGDEGPLEATFEREFADPLARVRLRAAYFRPPFLYAGLYARHLERCNPS
jgi:hypothetical protein